MSKNILHLGNNNLKQFLSILILRFLRTVGLKYDLYLKVCLINIHEDREESSSYPYEAWTVVLGLEAPYWLSYRQVVSG